MNFSKQTKLLKKQVKDLLLYGYKPTIQDFTINNKDYFIFNYNGLCILYIHPYKTLPKRICIFKKP